MLLEMKRARQDASQTWTVSPSPQEPQMHKHTTPRVDHTKPQTAAKRHETPLRRVASSLTFGRSERNELGKGKGSRFPTCHQFPVLCTVHIGPHTIGLHCNQSLTCERARQQGCKGNESVDHLGARVQKITSKISVGEYKNWYEKCDCAIYILGLDASERKASCITGMLLWLS